MRTDLQYLKEGLDTVEKGMKERTKDKPDQALISQLVLSAMDTVLSAALLAKEKDRIREQGAPHNFN